jgi:phage terminase large subunit
MDAVKVGFEVAESHLPLWERTDWRYARLMGDRGKGRSGTASRYFVSRLLSKEYTRGAIMRAVHADIRTSSWAEVSDRLNEAGVSEAFHITETICFWSTGRTAFVLTASRHRAVR